MILTLKLIARMSKFFAALLIISNKIILLVQQIIFRSVSSKILDASAKSFFSCMIRQSFVISKSRNKN